MKLIKDFLKKKELYLPFRIKGKLWGFVRDYHSLSQYEAELKMLLTALAKAGGDKDFKFKEYSKLRELYLPFRIKGRLWGFVIADFSVAQLKTERHKLWIALTKTYRERSFRARRHFDQDDQMFNSSFMVWINTPDGVYSHHVKNKFWADFAHLEEQAHGPKYDGHTIDDASRLLSLS